MIDKNQLSPVEQKFVDMMENAPGKLKVSSRDLGLPASPDDMEIFHDGLETVERHLAAHSANTEGRMVRSLRKSFQRTGSEFAALAAIGVERFAELMAEGFSLAEIAYELRVSHLTLARWIQSRGDSAELIATASRLGADALIAEATRRLRSVDVESRGGAAAASAFADFAKWRAATVDPDAFGPAGARVSGPGGSGVRVSINVDYVSELPLQAEVVDANVLRLNRAKPVDEGDTGNVVITVPHNGGE